MERFLYFIEKCAGTASQYSWNTGGDKENRKCIARAFGGKDLSQLDANKEKTIGSCFWHGQASSYTKLPPADNRNSVEKNTKDLHSYT